MAGTGSDLPQDELDAGRARALFEAARELAPTDAVAARDKLREAQGLWRGAVLADLRDVDVVSAWTTSLEALRRDVDELYVSCALGCRRHNRRARGRGSGARRGSDPGARRSAC